MLCRWNVCRPDVPSRSKMPPSWSGGLPMERLTDGTSAVMPCRWNVWPMERLPSWSAVMVCQCAPMERHRLPLCIDVPSCRPDVPIDCLTVMVCRQRLPSCPADGSSYTWQLLRTMKRLPSWFAMPSFPWPSCRHVQKCRCAVMPCRHGLEVCRL